MALAVALAAALATPALAQSTGSRDARDANAQEEGVQPNGQRWFQDERQQHSPNPAWDVYSDGDYVGSDPDPRVRDMLQSDPPERGQ